MRFFEHMGNTIAERWAIKHFDMKYFPGIAAQVLVQQDPATNVDCDKVLQWVLDSDTIPIQAHLGVGVTPGITVFNHSLFYIEVHFWKGDIVGMIAHDHSFAAAYAPLKGKRLEVSYTFESVERVQIGLELGRLKKNNPEMLKPGDVKSFTSGRACIHEFCRIEEPSVTLIVRTHHTGTPQGWTYLPPHISFAGHLNRTKGAAEQGKRQRVSDILNFKMWELGEEFHNFFQQFLLKSDPTTIFEEILEKRHYYNDKPDLFFILLDSLKQKHRRLIKAFQHTIIEQTRREIIYHLTTKSKSSDCNMVLSSLMVADNPAEIIDLLKQWNPSLSPAELFMNSLKDINEDILNIQADKEQGISDSGFQIIQSLMDGTFPHQDLGTVEYRRLKDLNFLNSLFSE